jgi:hypothetical protein
MCGSFVTASSSGANRANPSSRLQPLTEFEGAECEVLDASAAEAWV